MPKATHRTKTSVPRSDASIPWIFGDIVEKRVLKRVVKEQRALKAGIRRDSVITGFTPNK